MLVLRKLALLKLTAIMERYCPTHRTGWNWELPKFIRKIKTPDYKGEFDRKIVVVSMFVCTLMFDLFNVLRSKKCVTFNIICILCLMAS